MISLCIPTYNRLADLKRCLNSVFNGFENYPYEIVIADGGSTDGTLEYLHDLDNDNIVLIEQGKLTGIVKAVNACFKKAKGEYILNGNDDTVLFPKVLIKACKLMDKEEQIGLVAPKDQEIRHGNLPGVTLKLRQSWALLCKFHIFRSSVLKKINYFDESFRSYYVDDDSCISTMKLGYTTIFTKEVGMIHYRIPDEDINVARSQNYDEQRVRQDNENLKNKWKDLTFVLENYLEPYPLKKRKALYFAHICSKAYHSKPLQAIITKKMYDWMLDQSVIFRDEKYDGLKDFYLAQRYPDEVLKELK
jgi:GT2 family glycosyltransferase